MPILTGMSTEYIGLPSPKGDFEELSRSPKGKLFKKQILKFGAFSHPNIPGQKLVVDRGVAEKLVRNFNDGVCDIVQVPVVNDNNTHVEDPFRNIGEVIDLTVEDDGVYAITDVRKEEAAQELGKTLLGASAMMHMNYTDTKTGKKVGPTLLHMAITNRPYITNLKDFEEIVAASADINGETPTFFVETEEESNVTEKEKLELSRESALAFLKENEGLDIEELQRKAEEADAIKASAGQPDQELLAAIAKVLKDAGAENLNLSNEESEKLTVADVAEAVIELSQEKVSLAAQVQKLNEAHEDMRKRDAEAQVDVLIREGRVLPKQKDAMVELKLSNPEMFEKLLPEDSIVSLSEVGVETHEAPAADTQANIDRLVALANGDTQEGN